MDVPIHHLWYNAIDGLKVTQFREYEDNNPYFTACFFVGGAGVGKSACVTKFATVKRVHFVTPTNFAGTAIYSALRSKTLYVKASPTVFNLLGENLPDANYNNSVYRTKLDSVAKNGTATSLADLWTRLEPAFHIITKKRHIKISAAKGYLTPEEFDEVKAECVAQEWLTGDRETELEEILAFIHATKIVTNASIPLELTYDTLIIDEAGRMAAIDVLRLAYDYAVMRSKYGYPRKIKFILEGSCTQQTVINQTGWALNDFSALTMIAAPFFEDVPFFARLSTHNRRCSGGDLAKTAIWFNFVDKMEKGKFIPPSLKKKFFEAFGVPTFYPTKEEIRDNPEVLQRVYLATEHNEITKITNHLESHMKKVTVMEWFASTEKCCDRVPYISDPHENLGSGYRSVPYVGDQWNRTEHVDENGTEYRYVNERTLFVDGVYTLTHRARVTLTEIDAKPDQFLKDYALIRPYMTDEAVAAVTMAIIDYLTLTMWSLIKKHCPAVISQLKNVQSIWERIRLDTHNMETEDEEGLTNGHSSAVIKMESEILGILRVVTAAVLPLSIDFRRVIEMDVWANVILYKGYDFILTHVFKNMMKIRLGNSFTAALFRKPINLSDTSITNFPVRYAGEKRGSTESGSGGGKRPRYNNNYQKRKKPNQDDDNNDEVITEIVNDRLEGQDDNIVTGKSKGCVVTARVFPMRSSLTLTIAAAQSRTFTFNHVAYWGPNKFGKMISAEDVNVSATRLSDTSQFHVHVPNVENWNYSPFSKHTKRASAILRQRQSKVGHLL